MSISIIVAMDEGGMIGFNNQLPWHLPADLAYFKQCTVNKTIIMGRKTYESIGKPLPNRTNIVVTSKKDYKAPGCLVMHSVEQVLKEKVGEEEVVVIGGASVYEAFLPLATRLYITRVRHEVVGDTVFPNYDKTSWRLMREVYREADVKNPYGMTFCVYERMKS